MYSYTAAGLVTAKRLRLTRGTPTADLEADYTWDTEGRMTSVKYPTTGQYPNYIAGPTYSYGYNSMGQLNTMSQTDGPRYNPGNLALPLSMVSGANYGAAGELLSITGGGSSGYMGETRSYNSLFQVLTISAPQFDGPGVQVQYTYLNGTNIGKIDTQKILVNNGGVQSQEEVQYRYDALGRMIGAETTAASQGTVWGYSYGYDGYGNLGSKVVTKGTPSAGFGVGSDAANHLIGYSYDGNGNMTGQGSYSYDAENRLIQYGEGEKYGYDPSNKRIQKQFADGTEEIHFYGAAGEHLGVYALNANGYPYNMISFTVQTLNLYFGGKRLGRVSQYGNTSFVSVDRLGSEGPSNLYPWGEEKQASAQQNTERFATYYRDQGSGLDYADQRYYSSIMGRFLTPDPDNNSSDSNDPQSWNRYAYVGNDPVNFNDPTGLCTVRDLILYNFWFPGDPFIYFVFCDDAPQPPCYILLGCGIGGGKLPFLAPTPGIGLKPPPTGILGAIGILVGIILNPIPTGGDDTKTLQQQCDEQYEADLAICRQLQSASCYDQAMQRYSACLVKRPIPPFPYYPPGRPLPPGPKPRPR